MLQSFLALLGRVLITALFLWAMFGKVADFDGTMQYMASKKMPYIPFFLTAAILIQLIGGSFLLFGYKARLASWLLIAFTIPAAIIFHDYWNIHGSERVTEQIMFMNDVAIVGGLLAFAAFGPGRWSFDRG